MVPVRDSQDYLVILLVERVKKGRLGVMDNERPSEPIRILSTGVGMVPICSRLIKLSVVLVLLASTHPRNTGAYSKVVSETRAWSDRAL